ncbi:MAG: GTPase ObgE [Candidatus Omnitrophica bacterium]|nr:GTPase ObgE [Candidatus Omnitrophota bacterium]
MFIDQAKICIKAGSGGNGCNSFFRDNRVKRGKPDGGDGGNGGDVIIKAAKGVQTLLDFQYKRHFKAQRGIHGSSNNRNGKRGELLEILVPFGTVVKDAATGLVLRDLANDETPVIIAKGGKGGKGNSRQREATSGDPGEEKEIALELKLIADIGIIGYPNAGKSTFISKISSAKSKVADYPFTTKRPILGIVRHFGDRVLTFCDMPGLIQGAHEGRGLGDRFLRHIERTRLLLHMVDVSMLERTDPYGDFLSINKELGLYGGKLSEKKKIIAINKIDLPDSKKGIELIKEKVKERVFPISALTGEGIKELLDHIFKVAAAEVGE